MGDISRYGHRQRMRDLYLSGGMENAPDHNLLELFLSLVIPQKDVKPLAYDLMNRFGTLENIINADPYELMNVKGVGESTAVAISLIKNINKRISINKNNNVVMINSSKKAAEYCRNILAEETIEKFLVVTLTNSGAVINHHIVFEGNVQSLKFDLRKLMEVVLRDNAAGVIIAHNHPNGSAEPSVADNAITSEIVGNLRKVGINVIDHIIVGSEECQCMSEIKDCQGWFR